MPTVAEELAELKGIAKNLETKAAELGKPNYGAVRTDADGRVTSFFEDANESITLTPRGMKRAGGHGGYFAQKSRNERALKSMGYQPWGEFKSFKDVVRKGFEGPHSESYKAKWHNHYKAIQGMSEVVAADGGYAIMPEFAPGIIDRVFDNDLLGRTDSYGVSGNSLTFLANAETSRATGSRHGGMRGYWIGEGSSITKSKPTMREVTLKLLKLGVVVYLTQELIDDNGQALEQYVTRKAGEEFNFMIGDAIFNGTGVGQPLGVLNSPSLVSVAKEQGQLAATLASENIVKMYSRFYSPNLPSASWYYNQDVGPQLDLMTLGIGAAGIATYMPPGGLSDKPYGQLRGLPCQPTEFNPTLGTQGDIVLADLGQMLSITKGGIAQAVSMHLEFLTDQLALRFTMRLNIGPWESAPLTPYKGTNTQSSFVALDTRS